MKPEGYKFGHLYELKGSTSNGNPIDWIYAFRNIFGVSIYMGPEDPTSDVSSNIDPFYPPKAYINQTVSEQYPYFLNMAAKAGVDILLAPSKLFKCTDFITF